MKQAPIKNLLRTIEGQAARDADLTEAILDGVELRMQPLGRPSGLREYCLDAGVESLAIVISIGLASLVLLACLGWLDLANGSFDLFLNSGAGSQDEAMTSGLLVTTGLPPASAMARLIGNGMWVVSLPLGLLWFALRILLIPVPDLQSKQEETPCGIQ